MNLRMLLLLPFSCLALACQPDEQIDYGGVCVSAQEVDGQQRLVVEASTHDCAADHEGASFKCSITLDGTSAVIETVFQDGKDPDDSCAGPIETTCEADVEPGTLTIEFAGEQHELLVPGGQAICLPGGSPPSETDG